MSNKRDSGHLKTQKMCNEAVRINPISLAYVPDRFKTQGICEKATEKGLRGCVMSLITLRCRRCVIRQ